jgi:AcrR family transcriptional regulator
MPRPRRSNEERTATMRARLLDATVAVLADKGYARTTTTEVVRRARVSRGAQLHHFPTKAELVTTAVEHLFEQRHHEFLSTFARLPAGANRTAAAIDLLWSIINGPTFYAWLELVVASRTDARLRKVVTAITQRFYHAIYQSFRELFPGAEALGDIVPGFAFSTLQGLALDRIILPDAPHIRQVIDRLKLLGSLIVPTKPNPEVRP